MKRRKTSTKHLSTEEIKNYLDLNLQNREMYLIERHLLDCKLCQEALEGYEGAEFIHQQLQDLETRLAARVGADEKGSQPTGYWKYGIAAAIALVLGSVYYFVDIPLGEEQLSENEPSVKEEVSMSIDSTEAIAEPTIAMAETPAEESVIESSQPTVDRQVEETSPGTRTQEVQSARTDRSNSTTSNTRIAREDPPEVQTSAVPGAGEVAVDEEEPVVTTELSIEANDLAGGQAVASNEVILVEPSDEEVEAFQSLATDEARKRSAISAERNVVSESPALAASSTSEDKTEPRPTNGLSAYLSGIRERIQYPQEAIDNQVEGEVKVRFTVNIYGAIQDPEVIGSLGYGCDEEAVRVIQEGPNWLPGREGGIPIPATAEISIPFQLNP